MTKTQNKMNDINLQQQMARLEKISAESIEFLKPKNLKMWKRKWQKQLFNNKQSLNRLEASLKKLDKDPFFGQ